MLTGMNIIPVALAVAATEPNEWQLALAPFPAHYPAMLSRPLPLLVAFVLLICAGCGEQRAPAPSMADTPDAAEVARNLDADLASLAQLGGADRIKAEAAFGPRLRRDLEACQGTRYENKPLYMLAQWSLVHGGSESPAEVLRLVERLEKLPAPAFRSSGRQLRVQALLRLGRIAEARNLAQQLQAELPQFNALGRVEFYETISRTAPAIPGTPVSGGGIPDATMVLVAFIGLPDALAESWLQPLKKGCADGNVRLVVVTTAGDLLAAATVSSAWGIDVRWVRQGDASIEAWKLAVVPSSVLLGPGPQRVILAVEPYPNELARLGGGR